jgi:phosphate-selective porin OprO and OprP
VKKRIAVIAVMAAACAAQGAGAKTLEDVLKEKGVITESDYNEIVKSAPKSKAADYKLGNGFIFTSPDEKFQLAIGGQLQARYTFTEKGSVNAQSDVSEWRLRRAKTLFSGYVLSKDLTFKFNQNWASLGTFTSNTTNSNTSTVLEETFMNYRIIDPVQVRVGQDKVQFARQWITSSGAGQFVDSSFVTNAFRASYDTGLGINGSIEKGLVTYAAQWLGGKGQNIPQGTNSSGYNFRVAVNPLGEMKYSEADLDMSAKPLLSVGTSYYHNTIKRNADAVKGINGFDNNNLNFTGTSGWLGLNVKGNTNLFADKTNINVNMLEGDMAFKWQGVSLQSEYFWAEGTGAGTTSGNSDLISRGFYTQAGVFVVPKTVEVAARYSWMDYNQDKADSLKSEVQGAVSWYVNGHNLKIQTDVTKSYVQKNSDSVSGRTIASGSGANDTVVRAQAQLLF